jgi:uncharacterized small protein (DUF1192 family)
LFLIVQTVRHAYVFWLEPRRSVLDSFDQPLKDEIAPATSVDELMKRYGPIRKEVDRIKTERRQADPKSRFEDERDSEPFKSERALRQAISSWEDRAKEIRALRFYWLVGLVLVGLGVAVYARTNRWLGLTLLIVAFSEMIYWTCPTFLGVTTREFDRLLVHKLALSFVSLILLTVVTRVVGAFEDDKRRDSA